MKNRVGSQTLRRLVDGVDTAERPQQPCWPPRHYHRAPILRTLEHATRRRRVPPRRDRGVRGTARSTPYAFRTTRPRADVVGRRGLARRRRAAPRRAAWTVLSGRAAHRESKRTCAQILRRSSRQPPLRTVTPRPARPPHLYRARSTMAARGRWRPPAAATSTTASGHTKLSTIEHPAGLPR
jgi:hypothetical protein